MEEHLLVVRGTQLSSINCSMGNMFVPSSRAGSAASNGTSADGTDLLVPGSLYSALRAVALCWGDVAGGRGGTKIGVKSKTDSISAGTPGTKAVVSTFVSACWVVVVVGCESVHDAVPSSCIAVEWRRLWECEDAGLTPDWGLREI